MDHPSWDCKYESRGFHDNKFIILEEGPKAEYIFGRCPIASFV